MSDATVGKIAKYRKEGNVDEWWLTNFTMEQVEGRLAALLAENVRLAQEVEHLKADASKAVCVYCGHLCEKDLLVMGQHAAECENHPIHEVLRLRAALTNLQEGKDAD